MNNHCPVVKCQGLQISYDEFLYNESCVGTFQNKISDNVYQKGSSDIYLFFNPSLFRWTCGTKHDIDGCIALNKLKGYATHQSWYNADKSLVLDGQTIDMAWSNGHKATIQCINTAKPTASPTKSPSHHPTSPTRSPTSPTHAPTSPTKAPTENAGIRFNVENIFVCIIVCCLHSFNL